MDNKTPYRSLIHYLATSDNSEQILALLDALLTDKEQHDITNRIRIFDLLDQGVTQRDISKTLGVGIATVSRGAKAYHNHDVSELLNSVRYSKS